MLTLERLKETLDYDSFTGLFKWKLRISQRGKVGSIVGTPDDEGYIVIGIDGKQYKAHRLAWLYEKEVWPDGEIDHKDNIKYHNWIDNLRDTVNFKNSQNAKLAKNNKSGVKGVHWCKLEERWIVRISVDRKRIHLGQYKELTEAIEVVKVAREKFHGEFARFV